MGGWLLPALSSAQQQGLAGSAFVIKCALMHIVFSLNLRPQACMLASESAKSSWGYSSVERLLGTLEVLGSIPSNTHAHSYARMPSLESGLGALPGSQESKSENF